MFALFRDEIRAKSSSYSVASKAQEWSGADLTKWDTRNVVSFEQMFKGNSKFNGNVSTFQIQKATHLSEMFRGCTLFNGGLGTWDVSKVGDAAKMFLDAANFVSVGYNTTSPKSNPARVAQAMTSRSTQCFVPIMRQTRLLTHVHVSPISLIISNRLGPGSRSGRREV